MTSAIRNFTTDRDTAEPAADEERETAAKVVEATEPAPEPEAEPAAPRAGSDGDLLGKLSKLKEGEALLSKLGGAADSALKDEVRVDLLNCTILTRAMRRYLIGLRLEYMSLTC
eukprot:SAG31_NODE_13415_length_871_cov_0.987047_1_plen_114_part_00